MHITIVTIICSDETAAADGFSWYKQSQVYQAKSIRKVSLSRVVKNKLL
jgi:hypothetical protein